MLTTVDSAARSLGIDAATLEIGAIEVADSATNAMLPCMLDQIADAQKHRKRQWRHEEMS